VNESKKNKNNLFLASFGETVAATFIMRFFRDSLTSFWLVEIAICEASIAISMK
jgi:hypothetical protein